VSFRRGLFKNHQLILFLHTVSASLFLSDPAVWNDHSLLIGFCYLFPDFALRQTLLGCCVTQYYLSMMMTIVILGAVLLYVCENSYVRNRTQSCWHQLKKIIGGDSIKLTYKSQDVDEYADKERNLVRNRIENQIEGTGLLGTSGTGKTTLLNMINACGTKPKESTESLCKFQFGYSPQMDTSSPVITPYQEHFATISDMQQLKKKYGKGFKLTIQLKEMCAGNKAELELLELAIAEKLNGRLMNKQAVSIFP
jgi:hypothetical protein